MTASASGELYRIAHKLEAERVRLEPQSIVHAPNLFEVAQDEEIFRLAAQNDGFRLRSASFALVGGPTALPS